MAGRVSIVLALAKTLVFRCLNAIYILCRGFLWLCNGTSSTVRNNRLHYTRSTHKMRIVFTHFQDAFAPVSLSDFVLAHDDFVPPEYILKDNVTLLQITEDLAIFAEADPAKMSPYSPEFGFFGVGQVKTAVNIITMPLTHFNRLAEELGANEVNKILFVHNTGRSGSTLVCSLFAYTGRAISMSEPLALHAVCRLYGKAWDYTSSKILLKNVIRILTKPHASKPAEPLLLYAIKPRSVNVFFAETFQELFPSSVSIFLYRDPTASVVSHRRLTATTPTVWMFSVLMDHGGCSVQKKILSRMGLPGKIKESFNPKFMPMVELFYLFILHSFRCYYDLRQKDIDIKAVRYEDLTAKPTAMITKLLDIAGIPRRYVDLSLNAMQKDSQRFTVFSRRNMERFREQYEAKFTPSPELFSYIQSQADALGVPGPIHFQDKNFRLSGTIVP